MLYTPPITASSTPHQTGACNSASTVWDGCDVAPSWAHQKMICRTANTAKATPPQTAGLWIQLVCASCATSVRAYTSPRNSSSGLGGVTSVTSTVTTTQVTHDQSA